MAKNNQALIGQSSFLYDLFVSTDDKAFGLAKEIWDATGLPYPEEGEYFYREHNENGISVFLNPYGLVASFRARQFFQKSVYASRTVRHDNILQPLYRIDLSDSCSFEICPGVKRAGANKATINALASRLSDDGIRWQDRDPGFIGVLPGVGKGKVVVANRAAISVNAKTSKAKYEPEMQNRIFGGLSEQMTDAFSSASREKIQAAFGVCADITALKNSDPEKILNASWTSAATLGPRQASIVAGAAAYAKRLEM